MELMDNAAVARPVLAGAAPQNGFGAFVRSGATVEMKAFTGVTGDAGGWAGEVPRGYALRGGSAAAVALLLDGDLARGDGEHVGDLLLCASGPGQLHLAIRVPGGIVHADAGLGRVAERPGAVPWAVLGAWRLG